MKWENPWTVAYGPTPGMRYTWWTWKFGMTFTNWVLSFFDRAECDRCKRWVEGSLGGEFSAGVYVGWRQYMPDSREWVICDRCMWSDEEFLKDYPHMRGQGKCH